MREAPPRDAALDFTIGSTGICLSGALLWENWARLHLGAEPIFTPYHVFFYAALAVAACALACTVASNYRRGYRAFDLIPHAYGAALFGIPLVIIGELGDLVRHAALGVESRLEAATNPLQLIVGFGIVLLLTGPIRSALSARDVLLTLRSQLAMICAVAAILELAHLGMSYAFDPSAARMDAPPAENWTSPYVLLDAALVLYKTGTGVMIVILTSLVEMIFALFIASRFRLAPGAMTLFFILGDSLIATALTNDRPLLPIHAIVAIVAGVVADSILSAGRRRQHTFGPPELATLRRFGIFVPIAYYGTFFAMTIALEGTWWNWNLTLGTMVWSVLVGFGLTFLLAEPDPFAPSSSTLRSYR